jgi:predicted DNA-binding transcriptional regulator
LIRDQVFGVIILVASVVVLVVYAWFLYAVPTITLQITAFVAVGAVLVILAWIGWVMATTPPPAPLEAEPATTGTSSEMKGESGS